jgi:diaminopimelate epimerase
LIPFYKYHGTGNDFILIDNRSGVYSRTDTQSVAALCHRRFGIGADGLILLTKEEGFDFGMDYFNSDGNRSSMCGNGGRCITAFAISLGIVEARARFLAIDGAHEAITSDAGIKLKMGAPTGFINHDNDFVIHTGSPHYVRFISEDIQQYPVVAEGRRIRQSESFAKEGINVNFAHVNADGSIAVRTYERGVEDETWSCGTGVTAVAVVHSKVHSQSNSIVHLHTPGGELRVHVNSESDVWLEGPATFVFQGELPA